MHFHKLRLFVTLAQTQHFHRAAELCHVSPSTLSRTISQLEKEVNSRLFERDNRSVALTTQGEQLLGHARQILQQWETAQAQMQADAAVLCGKLSLYCSVTASHSFLHEILRDFRQQHPMIDLHLHTGDPALSMARVIAGQEDIAITARADTMPSGFRFKRICDSPLILISATKDHAFDEQGAWEDLPMIVSEQGLARERFDKWFRTHALQPNIYAQVAGNEAIVSMVSLGVGIGLVPKIVVDNSPLAGRVKVFSRQLDLPCFEVGACVLEKRSTSPIVGAFWQHLSMSNTLE